MRPAVLLLVSMAAILSIEQQVEQKKQDLIAHNHWATENPYNLQDKAFCLCTRCTTEPLMKRNAMVAKSTAYSHMKLDIKKKLVSEDAVTKANGSLTLVSYGDFFGMFRQYVAGEADENGFPCDPSDLQGQDELSHDAMDAPEREDMDCDMGQREYHDGADMPIRETRCRSSSLTSWILHHFCMYCV